MLVNADVSGLEVVVAADRYSDVVLKQELLAKVDIHQVNMETFRLPERRVAKFLKFRTIYGGGAWSFAHDPNFTHVSTSVKYWEEVLEAYFTKYKGIKKGHDKDIKFVKEHGFLEIPSGRYYNFRPKQWRGESQWPLTCIKNYPIQGFGAELVKLARIEAYKEIKRQEIEALLIMTVHDSIVADTPEKNIACVAKILSASIAKAPDLCYTNWSYKFSLPLSSEIQVGPNKADMMVYKL